MLFGYILPVLGWIHGYIFILTLTKHSVNLNCLGYGGSVSGAPQGRDRRNSGFSFPFLSSSPCPFISPNHLFLPLYRFQKWLLLSLPAYTPLHPSLSAPSLHVWWICEELSEDQDKVQEHISHLKKTLKVLICLKDEFLLFNNRHLGHQKETGIDFLRILVLPCPIYNSLSCLKPLARAWQMLQNLLLNIC